MRRSVSYVGVPKLRTHALIVAAALLMGLVLPARGSAAELKVLCTQALTGTFAKLGPQFERETGNKLVMTYGATGGLLGRVEKGEAFDVVIVTKAALDGLVKQGKVAEASRTDIVKSGIGVAMLRGAGKPDLASTEAFKKTMLGAKAITYTDPAGGGASGVYAAELMKRLGIADQMTPKTKLAPAGTSSGLIVAKGDAEYAIQMISELVPVQGIEIAGPLPPELQSFTVMSGAVSAGAANAAAARQLLQFLTSPAALPVIREAGLEPVK